MRHWCACFLMCAALFCSAGIPITPRVAVLTGGVAVTEAAGGSAAQAAAVPALPRTPDGKPDFSGIWQAFTTANFDIQDHSAQSGMPAGQSIVDGNELPYQPWALAKKRENFSNRAKADPECVTPGVPRIMYMPFPFQIVQQPNDLVFFFEYVAQVRRLHIGTDHPEGPIEWWMGDSRARWDGDTLENDVVHFNDNTWFDRAGNFHSDALHMIERYTLIDRDHINYEATLEDPKVFTRPWKMSFILYRRVEKNFRILDYLCFAFPLERYYPYPSVSEF